MNSKSKLFAAILFILVFLFDSTAFAKPGKGKKKGNNNSKKVVVVEKRVVEKKYVPQPISGWTTVNSPVYSRYCPFSCATEGIPKNHCRDWRQGDVCFVQDTSLNNYDYTLGRFINAPSTSPGEIVGQKIDREIARALR